MATRMRSPNYPSISLQDAIERVNKIYLKTQKHQTDPLVIAQILGYTSLNGGSITVISNLKKYGLLDDVGKQLKVSHDALSILFDPKDSAAYAEAIRTAALAPALFLEMHNLYGITPPSDEVLKSFLIKKGFSHTAVDAPIRSYRDTMELVAALPDEYNEKPDVKGDDNLNMNQEQAGNVPKKAPEVGGNPPNDAASNLLTLGVNAKNDMRQDVFSLDEGTVVLQWPAQMSADSYEDFESWIQLQLRKIKRSITS